MSATPVLEHSIRYTVPFHDLDPMGVVWHGNYLKYFEHAREALFDQNQVNLFEVYRDTAYAFPIVRSEIKHIHPLRYRDEITCIARLTDANRMLVVEFEIRLTETNELCTRGKTKQVAVRYPDMTLEQAIPAHIREALGAG